MAADVKTQDLLYVSDTRYGVGHVFVYSYSDGRPAGELAGVSPADGLCADGNGNVFVPAGTKILEYAHGATRPTAVLNDPYDGAMYCAVDPTTGNLAVSPTVVIYEHARGKGKEYMGGNAYGNRSCTYDSRGNLFVNGISGFPGPDFAVMGLVELRKSHKRFTKLNFPTLTDSATIQWDGKYIAAGFSGPAGIEQYIIDGKTAKQGSGWTQLELAAYIDQFWIQGNTVIVPSYEPPGQGSDSTAILLYNYPDGGLPTKIIDGNFKVPSGAVVSLAPH